MLDTTHVDRHLGAIALVGIEHAPVGDLAFEMPDVPALDRQMPPPVAHHRRGGTAAPSQWSSRSAAQITSAHTRITLAICLKVGSIAGKASIPHQRTPTTMMATMS